MQPNCTVFIKFMVVWSCPRPSHSSTTGSLTYPEQLPVPPAPLTVPALGRWTIFIFYTILFFMFRYTNTYHCVTTGDGVQYGTMLHRFVV